MSVYDTTVIETLEAKRGLWYDPEPVLPWEQRKRK